MIRTFKVEGDHLKELEKFTDLNPESDIGWIDLLSPTVAEDNAVEEFLQILVPTKEDMQEIEPSNRLYDEDGADYMTMTAVAQVHLDDPVKTPVTYIIFKNTLVTVHYEELMSFAQYIIKAQKKNGVTVASPHAIMLDITESFINRIADSRESLGSEIDQISNGIFRSKKITIKRKTNMLQSAIRKVGAKGDLLSMLRESLASVTRMMLHHSLMVAPENKALKIKINSLSRDVATLNDHAGFMSNKMTFLLEATLGMINLEQNQIIKIFSIAAVVFLPPTLVASVYGMNFHFMPELDSHYGYPVAVVTMIVSAVLPLLYFKKKGWL